MNKKRKTTLTAVGAAMAASLGLAASTPVHDAPLTAADVVVIDGQVVDADTIIAKQQSTGFNQESDSLRPSRQRSQEHMVVYGPRRPQPVVYGPRQPQPKVYGPPAPRNGKGRNAKATAQQTESIQRQLIELCATLVDADNKGIIVGAGSRLTRDLGMDPNQMKQLSLEIQHRYAVIIDVDQLEQFSTIARIARNIAISMP